MRRQDDPRYEKRTIAGCTTWMPTHERAEELRALVKEHMKPLDPRFGWKGEVEAVVPEELASDMREAMDFVGAIVDDERPQEDGKVRLYSEGYYVHIGS